MANKTRPIFANRKRRIIWSKLLSYVLLILVSVGLLYVAVTGYRRWAIDRLSNADILSRTAAHIILPKEEPKRIIRINNVESLRVQNDFYKGVEEGDFIIIYEKKAYIYDSRHDILRDVVN